jgi:hypothetical protein
MDLLRSALGTECLCGGRAKQSWVTCDCLIISCTIILLVYCSISYLGSAFHEHSALCKEQVLTLNSHCVRSYQESILRLLVEGGGKDLNHFYIGEASSGKTALTRPLLALFGWEAFVKPQAGTTFAFQGMVGCRAATRVT